MTKKLANSFTRSKVTVIVTYGMKERLIR